jgi:hypothetical protein
MTERICTIVVCSKPATHEGTVRVKYNKDFDTSVAYCDEHTKSQRRLIPAPLEVELKEITA